MVGKISGPLIVVLGPTAIGKTEFALSLAEAINGEVIGADSRQVYSHMDIGTAKPSATEMARVPHHLVDFIDPADQLTLARYQRMVYDCIDDVLKRGGVPLLVGGTGQYISAVTEGWSIPEVPPDESLRAELEAFARERGAIALHQRLAEADPVSAVKVHPNNIRRVIRALEVAIVTGKPISVLQQKQVPPYKIMELGFEMERHKLYERANERVDRMMQMGFLQEVQKLLDMGYDRKLPSMSGLGYAQLSAHILDDLPLAEAIAQTKNATHDFIRRQLTWFRGHDRGIMWHNVEQIRTENLITACMQWLDGE